MDTKPVPVIFIHGLWLHAESWLPWMELFREAGYDPMAPSWPGVPDSVPSARSHPEGMAGFGIAEVADHYAAIIRSLETKPVVIGHSFGGVVAQNLLGRNLASAAVAIDSAPIKGVVRMPLTALRVAWYALRNPANRLRKAVYLSRDQFRFAFGNAISAEESARLFNRWCIPSTGRPFFQAAFSAFHPAAGTKVNTANKARGPLLLIAGDKDQAVPPAIVRAIRAQYGRSPAQTDFKLMPLRGHSLTIDHGWREVAQTTLDWLERQPHLQAHALHT